MPPKTSLDPSLVWRAIQSIPRGEVASYGQIALRAGYPGRARWVARLLSLQEGPENLPWHRVLRSDGRIAFPPDSAPYFKQVERLQAEGVLIRNGRVAISKKLTIDEAIWG